MDGGLLTSNFKDVTKEKGTREKMKLMRVAPLLLLLAAGYLSVPASAMRMG